MGNLYSCDRCIECQDMKDNTKFDPEGEHEVGGVPLDVGGHVGRGIQGKDQTIENISFLPRVGE